MVATMVVAPLILVLLLFATQTLIRLHARSTVAALASEAARGAAVDDRPAAAAATRAGRVLRDDLGQAGADADIEWRVEPDRIEVHVRVTAPRLLAIGSLDPLNDPIEVVASARREAWR
jgi:hypothetical protein